MAESTKRTLQSLNPATGKEIAQYPVHTDVEVTAAIEQVARAFERWMRTPFRLRRDLLASLATLLRERVDRYATLMVEEMGKPVTQARAEVEKCAWVCDYYEQHAEEHLAGDLYSTDAGNSYVAYRPLGPVLAVMPWNFPFWQVFRFLAPALAVGNTSLLKHASNVSGSALAIEELVRDAARAVDVDASCLPLMRTVLVPGSRVGSIIAAPEVRGVTLTGSVPAGRAVAEAAGRALKPTVLELGGSDPYLVLADADIGLAASVCAKGRLINSGQSCIAAKRLIVVDAVYDEFREAVVSELQSYRVGDPTDEATDVGPLARHDLRDELHEQVGRSVAAGARLVAGGEVPDGPGAYYPVTILEDVVAGTAAYDEEIFGPVAALIRASDETDAIRIANDTTFGLGAAVFSRDTERARRIAEIDLEAGACFVNGLVKSDPRLPFGGVGDSGYGRELSLLGIREFVNAKTVWVR